MGKMVIFYQADHWRNNAAPELITEITWEAGWYPNGEQYLHLNNASASAVDDLTILAGFHDHEPLDQQLMRLWLLLEVARRTATGQLRLFIPYLPYSLQDRDVRGGDAAAAPAIGKIIAALGVDQVSVIDAHSPSTVASWSVPVRNLDSNPLLAAAVGTHLAGRNLAVVAPDSGAAAKAKAMSNLLKTPFYQFNKVRRGPGDVTIDGSLADCVADTVLLVDDLVNTGGTLIETARIVHQQCPSAQIVVVATHALLANQAWERLQAVGIGQAFFTNSYFSAPLRMSKQTNLPIVDIGSLWLS